MSLARWLAIGGVAAIVVAVALWLRAAGVFSAAAAMIALRATAVPFGDPPSVEALGADLPPLPVVLAMAVAAVPPARWDPLGPVVVSAVAAGLTAWWLFGSLRAIGLGMPASATLAAAATAHPAWLYAAASGSGTVLASALLIAALRLFRRWQRSGEALAILASAFALALAGLARYDLFVVGAVLALAVWRGPRARTDDRDERPAFAIAYAAAVAGALGLWLVTVGLITGDPTAFVARSLAAVAAPPLAVPPLHVAIVAACGLAAGAAATLLGRGLAASAAVVTILGAAAFTAVVSGSPPSLDAVLPAVPLTALLVGEAAAARPALRAVAPALAAPALVAAGALALALSPDWGEGHRAVVAALSGRPAPMWAGERALATDVRSRGASVVLDARVDAVAALLLRASGVGVVDVTAAATPPKADLVLSRTPTGRGSADRVDAAWPTLYEGGVAWARLEGTWPVSGEAAEYRLYAVTPVADR